MRQYDILEIRFWLLVWHILTRISWSMAGEQRYKTAQWADESIGAIFICVSHRNQKIWPTHLQCQKVSWENRKNCHTRLRRIESNFLVVKRRNESENCVMRRRIDWCYFFMLKTSLVVQFFFFLFETSDFETVSN